MSNNVRSQEVRTGEKARDRRGVDWPMLLGKVGIWMAIAAFGGVFWAVNGGFSVVGQRVMATSFNDAGALAWAIIESVRFPVPVAVRGLPSTQPLLPWIGVVAASLLQVCVVWLKLQGRDIPVWMLVGATLMSAYDLISTFFGLGTVGWIAQLGWGFQAILAFLLTFVVELTVSFMLFMVRR